MKGKVDRTSKNKDNDVLEEVPPQADKWWEDIIPDKAYEKTDYSGKMVLLLDLLAMSSERGDKALVFSQSLSTLDLIESFLTKLPRHGKKDEYWRQGKEWYRLDEHTSGAQRQKLVEKFNNPSNKKVQCVLISTRAGSLGINLPAANRVIIVDGSWNPTHDLQALFRVWRFGQTKHVYAYRLVAHGTMEEKIYKRQVAKEGLAARVVDKQQVHRSMTKEEVLLLFNLEDNDNTVNNSDGTREIKSWCPIEWAILGKTFLAKSIIPQEPSDIWEEICTSLHWDLGGKPYERWIQCLLMALLESLHDAPCVDTTQGSGGCILTSTILRLIWDPGITMTSGWYLVYSLVSYSTYRRFPWDIL